MLTRFVCGGFGFFLHQQKYSGVRTKAQSQRIELVMLINKDKALNFGFNMLMALGSRLTVANEALCAKDASAKTTLASHL
ncbi:hypothetical protein ACJIZ3_005409 [Penstemon smallii]|uniref:Uncharacterized protein n=1 Tax=Penstemon smallii TaxID=265156 RepID=A0ABD3S4T1_9LAMI